VRPANAGCFTVAHIGPTTRQHFTAGFPSPGSGHRGIDDADDRRIDRDEPRIARERGLARPDEVDQVADAGLHAVDRGLNVPDRCAVLVDGLHEQQLGALEAAGLAVGHDRALDDAEVHRRAA